MDLSGNICGCCCTVFPRAVLSPVDNEEEEELVALVVGPLASSKLLTCLRCRTQLTAFGSWLRVARSNIAKLRQVQEEQQVEVSGERERNSPDTTWSVATGKTNLGSPRLEISVRDSPSPPITWSRDNTVTIVALEDSQAKEAAAREANRVRNVRYRERKRAKEAELRGYISCVAVQGGEPVETIDVTPDLSITMEEEEEEVDDLERQEAVSPPPCHLPPIIVPTSTVSCFPTANPNLYAPDVDPEERRRRRNREASRRYRERARGDPELLRRMREQQNRRQKKYYARLKEKKQGGDFQEGPGLETSGFPIRGAGSFDSTPSSD